jgi:hypothetical protein
VFWFTNRDSRDNSGEFFFELPDHIKNSGSDIEEAKFALRGMQTPDGRPDSNPWS